MSLASDVLKRVNETEVETIKFDGLDEAFEVSKLSYPSGGYKDENVINWKADEIDSLAKMLGLKQKEKTTYGHGRFQLRGVDVSVDADRNKPAIVIIVGTAYDKRVRVKKLSNTQIKNLKAKIEKLVQDKFDQENRWEILKKKSSVLSKSGISTGNDSDYVEVDGISVNVKNPEKIDVRLTHNPYIYFSVSDGEKGIDKEIAIIRKELMSKLSKYTKAIEKVKKHMDKIVDYYEFKDKDNK